MKDGQKKIVDKLDFNYLFYIMKEEANQTDISSVSICPQPLPLKSSPYFHEYSHFFQEIKPPQGCLHKLRINGIQHFPSSDKKQSIFIKQIKASSNYQAVLMEVYFGTFVLTVSLLNRHEPSITHFCCQSVGKGAAGQIYECGLAGEEPQVIKCVSCSNYNSQKSPLVAVLQEYCFLKICAALEIGPKLGHLLGFDLVCYPDCIEFAMQKCQQISAITLEYEQVLKHSLRQLHELHIIHFDIKPQNIGFSQVLQKPVFLDFGFCRVVKQSPGDMKELLFTGTMGYCSEEMSQAYLTQSSRLIDPYFNDVVGLQRSVEYLRRGAEWGHQAGSHFYDPESYLHKCPSEFSNKSEQGGIYLRHNIKEREITKKDVQSIKEKQLLLLRLLHELFMMESYSIMQSQESHILQLLTLHHKKITSLLLHLYPISGLKYFYQKYIELHPQYDSKQLYTHFQKHPILEDNRVQNSIDFRYRIASVFDYELNFLANGSLRARVDPSQIFERLLAGKAVFATSEEYYFSLIEFIAFNRFERNEPIADKIRVCDVFLKEEINTSFKTVSAIQKTITHLLSLSLKPPLTIFGQYIFSMTFQQSCIMNIMSDKCIIELIYQIYHSKLTVYNKLVLYIEIDRCLLWFKARVIFHNFVSWKVVKNAIRTAVDGILDNKERRFLALQTYFNYEIFRKYYHSEDSFIQIYESQLKQLLQVQPNQAERKSFKLNLFCKFMFHTRLSKTTTFCSNFKAFERLFFERNREFFCSHHILLIQCYQHLHNFSQIQKLLSIFRARLDSQFDLMSFKLTQQIVRVKRDKTSLQAFKSYCNALIIMADEVKYRKNHLPPQIYQQLLAIKQDLRRLKEFQQMDVLILYGQICQRVAQHSSRFEYLLISTFQVQSHEVFLSNSQATFFLLDLVNDGQRQRLSRIFCKIIDILSKDCTGADCIYQHNFILYCKRALSSLKVEMLLENQDLQEVQKQSLKRIGWESQSLVDPEMKILEIYRDLILAYANRPEKRRVYGRKFFQALKSNQFLRLYFKNKELIYYVLEGIVNGGQKQNYVNNLKNACQLIRKMSQCVLIHYSVTNFVKLLASLRLFMERQVVNLSTSSVQFIANRLCAPLAHSPFLAVAVGLLLPCLSSKNLFKILIKVAQAMPFLSDYARKAIFKPYLKAIITQLKKQRAKIHAQTRFYQRYNCKKLQKKLKINMKNDSKKAIAMIVKGRRYYNNFNSMEVRQP